MDRSFLHPPSDLPRAFTFHISDSALVPGAAFPWPWLVVRRAGSPRGNMCSLLRGAGAGAGIVTGWRGGRNKRELRRSTKGAPQPAVPKASPARSEPDRGGRARGRGRPVPAGGSGAGAAARPPPGEPAGAARGVGAGRRLRMAQTPRSQGRAARLPLGCLALPPARRFPGTPRPAGCALPGWGGPGAGVALERPGLRAEIPRGPHVPVPLPALSSSAPPGIVLGGAQCGHGIKEFTSGACIRADT